MEKLTIWKFGKQEKRQLEHGFMTIPPSSRVCLMLPRACHASTLGADLRIRFPIDDLL